LAHLQTIDADTTPIDASHSTADVLYRLRGKTHWWLSCELDFKVYEAGLGLHKLFCDFWSLSIPVDATLRPRERILEVLDRALVTFDWMMMRSARSAAHFDDARKDSTSTAVIVQVLAFRSSATSTPCT
jgi:hypothetical protein